MSTQTHLSSKSDLPRRKRRSLALGVVVVLGALLGGCIVVPVGPAHYYHPYYRYY